MNHMIRFHLFHHSPKIPYWRLCKEIRGDELSVPSNSVSAAAASNGFASLPQFMAQSQINLLLNKAMCGDKTTFALAKYKITPTPIQVASAFKSVVENYRIAYTAVDTSPSATWYVIVCFNYSL